MHTNPRNNMMINDDLLLGTGPDGIAGIFATEAGRNAHSVVYIMKPNDPCEDANKFSLSVERMRESNNYMVRSNKSIHRSWPTGNNFSDDCIRRDSFLVRWCHRVYAIGLFTDDASLLKISGDLAWPCQVYIDRFLYDQEPMGMCELYFFDLKSESWFQWRNQWMRSSTIPKPYGIYTVVGNDRLSRAARQAIDDLWVQGS